MVVGDDDDSSAVLSGDIAKEFHDLTTTMAIERSGRFIVLGSAKGARQHAEHEMLSHPLCHCAFQAKVSVAITSGARFAFL